MTNISLSKRFNKVPASPMRKLIPYTNLAKKQGVKIYYLNIGDPDIKTPEIMLKTLKTWKANPIPYGQSQGEESFLNALQWYYHRLGFSFIKTSNIQVTTGSSEAISFAILAVTNPGEEIITFEPYYANYNSYAAANSTKIVPILTDIKNGFHLPDIKEIEKKITKKTKAILLYNPNNPTGTVYTQQEIEMLVKIVKKHCLFLIVDEVYREFTYDGKSHVSLLSYMS